MKRIANASMISALAVAASLGSLFSSVVTARQFDSRATPTNGACFYEHANYRGAYFCVSAGESVRSVPRGMNDQVSSIRVFGGARVTIYKDDNFRGDSVRFDETVRNLDEEGWNDTLSSVRVQYGSGRGGGRFGNGGDFPRSNGEIPRQGACFYRDSDFRGDRFCLSRGETVSAMPLGFNDEISSVQVFGASVMIFEDENFGGQSIRISSNIRDLSESRSPNGFLWNDRVSSLRVF